MQKLVCPHCGSIMDLTATINATGGGQTTQSQPVDPATGQAQPPTPTQQAQAPPVQAQAQAQAPAAPPANRPVGTDGKVQCTTPGCQGRCGLGNQGEYYELCYRCHQKDKATWTKCTNCGQPKKNPDYDWCYRCNEAAGNIGNDNATATAAAANYNPSDEEEVSPDDIFGDGASF